MAQTADATKDIFGSMEYVLNAHQEQCTMGSNVQEDKWVPDAMTHIPIGMELLVFVYLAIGC